MLPIVPVMAKPKAEYKPWQVRVIAWIVAEHSEYDLGDPLDWQGKWKIVCGKYALCGVRYKIDGHTVFKWIGLVADDGYKVRELCFKYYGYPTEIQAEGVKIPGKVFWEPGYVGTPVDVSVGLREISGQGSYHLEITVLKGGSEVTFQRTTRVRARVQWAVWYLDPGRFSDGDDTVIFHVPEFDWTVTKTY
jgi:hypothetical protein